MMNRIWTSQKGCILIPITDCRKAHRNLIFYGILELGYHYWSLSAKMGLSKQTMGRDIHLSVKCRVCAAATGSVLSHGSETLRLRTVIWCLNTIIFVILGNMGREFCQQLLSWPFYIALWGLIFRRDTEFEWTEMVGSRPPHTLLVLRCMLFTGTVIE